MSAEVASRPTEASRDHMIPQAFTAFLSPRKKAEFNADWNLQPMHKPCNERRRGQFAGNWPLFTCRCHYLQIADGHIYVHDRLQENDRRHLTVRECGVQRTRSPGAGCFAHVGGVGETGAAYVCCHRCALPHVQVAPVPHDHPDGQMVAFGNYSLAPGTYEAAAR